MSLKQKEEITIWAFKDGKKGHEKQIEALISEFKKHKRIKLHNFFDYSNHDSIPHIILGAGNGTHKHMLAAKKRHKNAKTIVLMKPSLRPIEWFDIAIVPSMDKFYFKKPKNVITTDGVLTKYSNQSTKDKTGLIVIGGKSRHFKFKEAVVREQITWLLKKFDDYEWKITTSPRSPNMIIKTIRNKHLPTRKFFDWNETSEDWLSEQMKTSELTFITPESVSVLYEALSTKTKTFAFGQRTHIENGKVLDSIYDHATKRNVFTGLGEYDETSTKVSRNIRSLITFGRLGYIETGIGSSYSLAGRKYQGMNLVQPKHHNVLKEVQEVVTELLKRL